MKVNTTTSLILFLSINFSFICYGLNLYSPTILHTQIIESYTELNIKDTLRTRYYEAPYDESPFGTFKIIDTTSMIVYTQKKSHRRYGSYFMYYYSLNLKSRIHELSKENLEVDFADNNKFLELVNNNNLPLWKIEKEITVVNKLLLESLK